MTVAVIVVRDKRLVGLDIATEFFYRLQHFFLVRWIIIQHIQVVVQVIDSLQPEFPAYCNEAGETTQKLAIYAF